jgi:hypothetical protein
MLDVRPPPSARPSASDGRPRLTSVPERLGDASLVPVGSHMMDAGARIEILRHAAPTHPAATDWILRFLTRDGLAGYAEITEFRAPGPNLDSALFRVMDAHSADACAAYLVLRRYFVETLPALGGIAYLANLQVLPGHYRGASWRTGFAGAVARIPWRGRTPALLIGLPYPMEYLGAPDLAGSPAFQARHDALIRFYTRSLGYRALHDNEDIWVWQARSLQARMAEQARLILKTETRRKSTHKDKGRDNSGP